jgi:uncharacterized protein (DUF1330 family)
MSNGKPLSPEVRATRTNTQLVQNINRSTRSDCGGKDKIQYIMDKVGCSEEMARDFAEVLDHQIEGIRKRTSHDREELLQRFEAEDLMEKTVSSRCEWKPKSLIVVGFEDPKAAAKYYDSGEHQKLPGAYGAQFHRDAKPFLLLQKFGRIVLDT